MRMNKFQFIGMAVVVLLSSIIGACAKPSVTEIAPTSKATAPTITAQPAWQDDWDRTLAAARKEGSVLIYQVWGVDWRTAFDKVMEEKYGIRVDTVSAKAAELVERIMTEQRNGMYQSDVAIVPPETYVQTLQAAGAAQPLEKMLLLPEVIDPKVWLDGKFPWIDPDAKTFMAMDNYVSPLNTANTNLVKPGEIKHWVDLLSPKWKGKIVMTDPTVPGGGQMAMKMIAYGVPTGGDIRGWDYVKALAKQEPVITRDATMWMQWLAQGKYAYAISATPAFVVSFIKEGGAIEITDLGEEMYLIAGNGGVMVPKGAPHPNAAKIFVNFLLSKEGQTINDRVSQYQSARIDVPTSHLLPVMVRKPGIKYLTSNAQEYLKKDPELAAGVAEIFKPLAGR